MARHLLTKPLTHLTRTRTPLSLLSPHRTLSTKPQFIEIDLEPSPSSSPSPSTSPDGSHPSSEDLEPVGVQRLEEAFHRMMVARLEPEWLPFRPGSSFWVPPRKKAHNILELVGKLTSPSTMEQALSFSSTRGFPCSAYFLGGAISEYPRPVPRPVPVVVEVVQVHGQSDSEQTSSDDED